MHHFYLSQKCLIRYLVKYGIASIAILVALNQLRLRRDGLSSWKGGGFGMYAEMHPVYNKVFIKSKSNQRAQRKFEPSRESVLLMQKIRHFSHQDYQEDLKNEYATLTGINDLVIEVWIPEYNAERGSFKMILYHEY